MSDVAAPLMVSVSGVRGITGKSLTRGVVTRYARAVGAWFAESANGGAVVALGRDGRAGGEEVYGWARSGLVAAGVRVVEVDIAMTPSVGVAVDQHGANGAMIVTASHNPQEWNGLKTLVRGADASGVDACAPNAELAARLIALYEATEALDVPDAPAGSLVDVTHGELVCERVAALGDAGETDVLDVIRKAELRVVLDSVNGAGRMITGHILRGLGVEVEHLGKDESGIFWHTPEPTRENLEAVSDLVEQANADVGFAQDPDADRLALLDENGTYIGEEYTIVLAAMAMRALGALASGSAVAVNLSTSRMIDDVMASFGGRVERTPVGEANVVDRMKTLGIADCPLGGEGNGGVIWSGVTYVRDSLTGMVLVLALMAKTGKTLSELVASIPSYAIVKRKSSLANRDDATPAMERVAKAFASEHVDLQDGVRIDFEKESAWAHVRPSNTEPILRVIAEAPTEAEANAIADRVEAAM